MEETAPMSSNNIIRFPGDDEIQAAFERYAMAVGSVAYSWNRLHETLGTLYWLVSGYTRDQAFETWYRHRSDSKRRDLLRATVTGLAQTPSVFDLQAEIVWLLSEAKELAEERNDAIHAPATLHVAHPQQQAEMGAMFFNGDPRAERLRGKNLLSEFERCDAWACALYEYTKSIIGAWGHPDTVGRPPRPARPVAHSF